MGHKNICFTCRKAFSLGTDIKNRRLSNCPECGQPMTQMTHRFRPPKKDDDKKWETTKFLVDHGFVYQHVYENKHGSQQEKSTLVTVDYPENIRDAEEFVKKYKSQALA